MTELEHLKLLLVEDDEDDYFLFKDVLKSGGGSKFELTRVSTGAEAIASLSADAYDAAFFDYYLGADSGLDIIRSLRAKAVDVPLILLTGRSDLDIESAAVEAGASDFLEKGKFDYNSLWRSLRYAINRTYQHRLEQAGRQSQKLDAIGLLAGGIAHDFNNILAVIMGYADLLLGRDELPEDARAEVKQIYTAGERAARLTKQILMFTRKQPNSVAVADINKALIPITEMLRRVIGENISLTLNLNDSLPKVEIDIGQLEQLVLNLAVNARDAMPGGGNLTIGTKHKVVGPHEVGSHSTVTAGEYIELTVADSGVGMTEEVQKRIFEPFFTTKEVGKGTGLGLSTVYGIVKQAKAAIDVHSELGKGTTFFLYLPVTHTVEELPQPPNHAGENLKGSERILLVEDEDVLRNLIGGRLETYGYQVTTAGDGEQGLNMALEAGNSPPQLIITDVMMPKKDGREMVADIRKRLADVKVIYMSGYAKQGLGDASWGLNENTMFIQKPFSFLAMLEMVRTAFDKH